MKKLYHCSNRGSFRCVCSIINKPGCEQKIDLAEIYLNGTLMCSAPSGVEIDIFCEKGDEIMFKAFGVDENSRLETSATRLKSFHEPLCSNCYYSGNPGGKVWYCFRYPSKSKILKNHWCGEWSDDGHSF